MKIRSLLLGSLAAAGLTTGAFAADPTGPVLTTLDLCDALGLTGLTVSSDNNCLQITGEVKYEFKWGDYKGDETVATVAGGYDPFKIIGDDAEPNGRDQDWESKVEAYLTLTGTADTDVGPAIAVIKFRDRHQRVTRNENNLGRNNLADTSFYVDDNTPLPDPHSGFGFDGLLGTADDTMRSVGPDGKYGTADDVYRTRTGTSAVTAVGPGTGADGVAGTADDIIAVTPGPDGIAGNDDDVITLAGPNGIGGDADDVVQTRRGAIDDYAHVGGDDTGGFEAQEAYVAIGGATVLSAGRKGTIMKKDDDTPFNWLSLFLSEKVDAGVNWYKDSIRDGGHVIQLVHDFGNGLSGGVALEALERTGADAGTAVGVLWYAGDMITAHATVAAGGILDGTVENWGVHAGITGTFDILKVRAAVAGNSNNAGSSYWNALASAEATFDIFKIAWSGEAASGTGTYNTGGTDFGVGASAGVTVTDGITINLGGRYYSDANGPDGWQAAAQVVAAITETITVTGEVGVYGVDPGTPLVDGTSATDVYGKLSVAWAPGGGFTSTVAGEVHQNGGYRATFSAGKVFN